MEAAESFYFECEADCGGSSEPLLQVYYSDKCAKEVSHEEAVRRKQEVRRQKEVRSKAVQVIKREVLAALGRIRSSSSPTREDTRKACYVREAFPTKEASTTHVLLRESLQEL